MIARRAAVLALALALPAARARAQGVPPASDVSMAQAREQYRQGVAFVRAGRRAEARAAFERVDALSAQPLNTFNLAGACVQTRQLVRATELYRRFLREATTPPASGYRDGALAALADAERRVAHARLVITPAPGPRDALVLDGAALPSASLSAPLPVDPGPHELRIERRRDADADAVVLVRARFVAREGVSTDVPLRLAIPAPEVTATTTRALVAEVRRAAWTPPSAPAVSPRHRPARGASPVAVTLGVAAFVAVVATGAVLAIVRPWEPRGNTDPNTVTAPP